MSYWHGITTDSNCEHFIDFDTQYKTQLSPKVKYENMCMLL